MSLLPFFLRVDKIKYPRCKHVNCNVDDDDDEVDYKLVFKSCSARCWLRVQGVRVKIIFSNILQDFKNLPPSVIKSFQLPYGLFSMHYLLSTKGAAEGQKNTKNSFNSSFVLIKSESRSEEQRQTRLSILMCVYRLRVHEASTSPEWKIAVSPPRYISEEKRQQHMKNSPPTTKKRKIRSMEKSRVGKIHNFFSYACRSATNSELERRQGFSPNCWVLALFLSCTATRTFFHPGYDIKQYFLGLSIPVHSVRKNILLAVVCFL